VIRYAYIIVFLFLSFRAPAQEDTTQRYGLTPLQEDTTVAGRQDTLPAAAAVVLPDSAVTPPVATLPGLRQLRLGVDITKPLAAVLLKDRMGIEVTADYYLRKELYLVAEGGGGNIRYHYPDLSYSASNSFLRIGIDKSMLPRVAPDDWDMVFIGARYGIALVQLSDADYITKDPFWGATSGAIPSRNFTGHWFEVTGGMRVEMIKGFFIGWNVRGRFLLNRSAFRELAPLYIAGYGRGDKNGVFDFNFYLSYALRKNGKWKMEN
jgi:hypothetical protein